MNARYRYDEKMKPSVNTNGATATPVDLSSRSSVERFREAVKAFTAEATRSKRKARNVLISTGIYTKSGRLAKNYR